MSEVSRLDRDHMTRWGYSLTVDLNDSKSLMGVPRSIREHALKMTGRTLTEGNGRNGQLDAVDQPNNVGKVAESGD